ncbi:DgyrCDS13649 [Dimorphilus gyrociliatus]|uniref:DgyrCDS13649 n=1 Tax=Dimorphilus gyrociliatus TaxID=2664684 RepID=A0A7I8WBB5_9ANNE|nr:DgyrCDS13649 [Dimorphilus gyrociliatus]
MSDSDISLSDLFETRIEADELNVGNAVDDDEMSKCQLKLEELLAQEQRDMETLESRVSALHNDDSSSPPQGPTAAEIQAELDELKALLEANTTAAEKLDNDYDTVINNLITENPELKDSLHLDTPSAVLAKKAGYIASDSEDEKEKRKTVFKPRVTKKKRRQPTIMPISVTNQEALSLMEENESPLFRNF